MLLAKNILANQKETLREHRTKELKDAQPTTTLCIPNQITQNHVTCKDHHWESKRFPMKAASPNKGPSIIPMEERFWRPIPKAQRYESCETAFEACTQCSSTRTSSSRTRWSNIMANIEAENDRIILSRTFLELRYVGGDVKQEQQTRWDLDIVLDARGEPQYMRSRKVTVAYLRFRVNGKTHNCHTGSSDNYKSIVSRLTDRRGRQNMLLLSDESIG